MRETGGSAVRDRPNPPRAPRAARGAGPRPYESSTRCTCGGRVPPNSSCTVRMTWKTSSVFLRLLVERGVRREQRPAARAARGAAQRRRAAARRPTRRSRCKRGCARRSPRADRGSSRRSRAPGGAQRAARASAAPGVVGAALHERLADELEVAGRTPRPRRTRRTRAPVARRRARRSRAACASTRPPMNVSLSRSGSCASRVGSPPRSRAGAACPVRARLRSSSVRARAGPKSRGSAIRSSSRFLYSVEQRVGGAARGRERDLRRHEGIAVAIAADPAAERHA